MGLQSLDTLGKPMGSQICEQLAQGGPHQIQHRFGRIPNMKRGQQPKTTDTNPHLLGATQWYSNHILGGFPTTTAYSLLNFSQNPVEHSITGKAVEMCTGFLDQ